MITKGLKKVFGSNVNGSMNNSYIVYVHAKLWLQRDLKKFLVLTSMEAWTTVISFMFTLNYDYRGI